MTDEPIQEADAAGEDEHEQSAEAIASAQSILLDWPFTVFWREFAESDRLDMTPHCQKAAKAVQSERDRLESIGVPCLVAQVTTGRSHRLMVRTKRPLTEEERA